MPNPYLAKRPRSPSNGRLSPPPVKRKIESTTTSKAVASFFKPASQKEVDILRWRILDKSLIVGKYGKDTGTSSTQASLPFPRKVAAFDLDDTLISSTAPAKFVKSAAGWKWWDASVPNKLKQLHDEGYLLVILSNQGNISLRENTKTLQKDNLSLSNFKSQVTAVLGQLNLPISIYAATDPDKYRKPRLGMWQEMRKDYGLVQDELLDLPGSFFVGDAAGREKTTKRQKDHSCSDRDLASNIRIKFHTPEEFFLNEAPEPFVRAFEPKEFLDLAPNASQPSFSKRNPQDIVLLCGSPGAGKSSFYWQNLKPIDYERVNQDILKTRDRCLKLAKDHLSSGVSVAVDNTNADPNTRAYWINLARDFKIPIRCVHFTANSRLCEHNDCVRSFNTESLNPEARTLLPPIAFRSFAQRYIPPSVNEGFQDIVIVDFHFQGSMKDQQIWSLYWLSKFST